MARKNFIFPSSIHLQCRGQRWVHRKAYRCIQRVRNDPKIDDFGRTFFMDAPYLCVTFSFCRAFLNTISGLDNIKFKVQVKHVHDVSTLTYIKPFLTKEKQKRISSCVIWILHSLQDSKWHDIAQKDLFLYVIDKSVFYYVFLFYQFMNCQEGMYACFSLSHK